MASCAPYQARARAGGAEEGRVARRRVRRAARCCAGWGEADGGASPKRPQKKLLALPPAAPTGLVPLHRAERSGPPATLRRDQAAALVFRAATGGSTAAASDADELFAAPAWDLKALAKPSASPRRTSVMRFTCEACGTLNYHFVNPLAFGKGTIFATCSQPDCGVTHTVVDNLDLVWTGEEASAEGSSDSGSA